MAPAAQEPLPELDNHFIEDLKLNIKKTALIILILLLVILIKYLDISHFFTLENLKSQRQLLLEFVQNRYLASVFSFIVIYIFVTAFSIPGATILTLTGGFLFTPLLGTVYVNIGATIGAGLVFLAARYLIGDWVQKRYFEKLISFNRDIEKNGKNYLLTLRLIPLFPFFLVNLLPALTKIPFRTFLWTTSLGIIPGTFIYAYAGRQFLSISSINEIFSKEIILAFSLLGILVLVPVIYKRFKDVETPA